MSEVAEAAEPDEPEEDAPTPDPVDLAAALLMELKWAQFFRGFLERRDPVLLGNDEEHTIRPFDSPLRIAERKACVACYDAIRMFAERFAPAKSFTLDVSRAGRDW